LDDRLAPFDEPCEPAKKGSSRSRAPEGGTKVGRPEQRRGESRVTACGCRERGANPWTALGWKCGKMRNRGAEDGRKHGLAFPPMGFVLPRIRGESSEPKPRNGEREVPEPGLSASCQAKKECRIGHDSERLVVAARLDKRIARNERTRVG